MSKARHSYERIVNLFPQAVDFRTFKKDGADRPFVILFNKIMWELVAGTRIDKMGNHLL